MIANLQNTMYGAVAGSMAGGGALPDGGGGQNVSLFTSPLFHVSGCHSTLVVGLLAGLKLVMPEGRFTPETALELIQEHGSRCGRRCRRWCGGSASTRTATTTTRRR